MAEQQVLEAPQQLIEAAKAPIVAYGNKDWTAVKAGIAPGVVYDEVATHRRIQGADEVINLWRGWATAFPDSRATFHNAVANDGTATVELTWRGTHTGPLKTADGEIAATGKKIEVRACQVVEVANGKVNVIRQYFDMATMLQQLGVKR
jgi:steroid delta-isomerase-like uncharacterized protein